MRRQFFIIDEYGPLLLTKPVARAPSSAPARSGSASGAAGQGRQGDPEPDKNGKKQRSFSMG